MTYELAKKLEKAGFKRKPFDYQEYQANASFPNLSELIEACGEYTIMLWGCKKHGYYAAVQPCNQKFEDIVDAQAQGSTPKEAVANLWIELNKK